MSPKNPKHAWPGSIAETADRHEYYEKAVQAVDAEVDMVAETFERIRGHKATILREDFCGTANTSCEWIGRDKKNRAIGIDLSKEVLDWGKQHNLAKLSEKKRQRIDLNLCDVMDFQGEKAELIVAMNFSYQLFKTRETLLAYFKKTLEGLTEDGVFIIDSFGGHESWREIKERTKYDGFKYYWHQKKFDPISHEMLCHIHFKFDDGSWMKKAFTYDWRIWTLPELQELMTEAGYKNVTVYWEGTDEESGEGNGEYSPAQHGEDDPSWICYLSGEK